MVDIDTHNLLDMIPSRELEDVTEWLRTYPNLNLVSRDGSITYHNAISMAHPEAIQVSDRFHLFKNLIDYGKEHLKKKLKTKILLPMINQSKSKDLQPKTKADCNRQLTLKEKYDKLQTLVMAGMKKTEICKELNLDIRTYKRLENLSSEAAEKYFYTTCEVRSHEKILQKMEKVNEIRNLKVKGYSKRAIAKKLGLSRSTIDKYLSPDFCPVHGSTGQSKGSKLDPYKSYIEEHLSMGIMGSVIETQIRKRGYKGSSSTVRHYCSKWKKMHIHTDGEIDGTKVSDEPSQIGVERKKIFKLLYHPVNNVKSITEEQFQHLREHLPAFEKIHTIIWSFREMVAEQRHEDLQNWIAEAELLEIEEIQSFVNGIKRDIEAVKNAIKYEQSNGLAEGTVNKLKVIKRIMYGRCCFDTLRIKALRLEKMRKIN
jgi:predicted transcriptional regulator